MGTVQKIVESLMRISDDKKTQLTARYTEHSHWMSSELALIRELIKQSPRDEHKTIDNNTFDENDENIPPVPPARSSSTRNSCDEEKETGVRNKRKTPEMPLARG